MSNDFAVPDHNEVGRIGEDITCRYLKNLGFKIKRQNYRKKAGEIDVIAEDNKNRLHFVEVKTVTRNTIEDVTRETGLGYRPEDNLHPNKLKRLSRAIQIYLGDKTSVPGTDWFFDVSLVYLVIKDKKAKVDFIKDITLS